MKKLLTWFLGFLWVILFSWAFLVAFIVQAPVDWLVVQAQQKGFIQQVTWKNIEGSLAKGSVKRIDLPGISLENLGWHLPVWRLVLGFPQLNLKLAADFSEKNEIWQLQAGLTPWGSLTAKLQAGDLSLLRSNGLPWAMQGQLNGQLYLAAKLTQQNLVCEKITGSLQGNLKALQPMPLDLGQINLQPACSEEQSFSWLFTADKSGEHQISLQGRAVLTDRYWNFTAQARLEEQAKLRPALQMLGWRRDNQGNLWAKGSGRF